MRVLQIAKTRALSFEASPPGRREALASLSSSRNSFFHHPLSVGIQGDPLYKRAGIAEIHRLPHRGNRPYRICIDTAMVVHHHDAVCFSLEVAWWGIP